ncbi:uncharacterized protein LOC119739901 [Patiria miniata]|uniref:BHLH domain-containing protein n=1 Tax=Patiria miniata TaxID=46514 RepID=A0A914B3S2_PATMI|nr:uncharacterized protein LOC119739901 [Patiria miniata]
MSWEKSPSPDGHHQERGEGRSTNPSEERSCKEEQDSKSGQGGCSKVTLSSVSPVGSNSRRNKRKQSEPRRLSTSSLVVKEEPADAPDHPDDQGRLTAPGLTIETEDDYRCGVIIDRRRYQHQYHLGGVEELIPENVLSLQGHTSRASNSSEDSQGSTATSLPMHSVMMYARGSGGDSGGGMISDEAKSDLDDATGSQGTCADSPELMMEEGEAMDGDSRSSHAEGASPDSGASSSRGGSSSTRSKKTSRSYKNLSRSRRIVANARERNRVHTISAAFEGLRRAVPSYSHNQKLSKLAILRIACSYILALANLADMDYSPDHQQMSFSDCVDMCTRTLQSEGRSKRRKVPME